jgi:hypothetical protein
VYNDKLQSLGVSGMNAGRKICEKPDQARLELAMSCAIIVAAKKMPIVSRRLTAFAATCGSAPIFFWP